MEGDASTHRRIGAIALAIVILIVAMGLGLTLLPRVAASWSGTISQNTSTLYAFTTARIIYTFTSTGTQGWTSIIHFKVYFDWMPYGIYYGLGPVDPIPDGGSASFYLNLTVPNAVGSHTQTINITAMAEGDPVSTTKNYTETISIVSIPPLQLSIAANPRKARPTSTKRSVRTFRSSSFIRAPPRRRARPSGACPSAAARCGKSRKAN